MFFYGKVKQEIEEEVEAYMEDLGAFRILMLDGGDPNEVPTWKQELKDQNVWMILNEVENDPQKSLSEVENDHQRYLTLIVNLTFQIFHLK